MCRRSKSILQGIGDPVLDVLIARLDELPEIAPLDYLAIAREALTAVITGNIIRQV